MSELGASEAPQEAGAPAWMATFADMMSLLLTFFILLLSFAEMDVVKFKDMLGSVQDALGVHRIDPGPLEAESTQIVEIAEPAAPAPTVVEVAKPTVDDELLEVVQYTIRRQSMDNIMEATMGERGVTIRTDGKLMFQTASDVLKPEAARVMREIASVASYFPDHLIAVEGHTDDVPISTERFPSNWELSAARAVAGVRHLVDHGGLPGPRVSASGFADTRPVLAGTSEEARGLNRRLEFVFYRDHTRDADAYELDEMLEKVGGADG